VDLMHPIPNTTFALDADCSCFIDILGNSHVP
jgi:hypothetical protein